MAILMHVLIQQILHFVYELLGHTFCKICLIYWEVRDVLCPPKEKAVLFVAHPDDDVLFFHTFIKENKPYVVLCTTGWSLRRMPGFIKTMKYYGVKFRAYDMGTFDKRVALLRKRIRHIMDLGHFEICATHNVEGEYGHEMHSIVHEAVLAESGSPVFVPVNKSRLTYYPLDVSMIEEKKNIFNNFYTTERWAIDLYAEWMNNERLELVVE